jgi:hypothetical protein
MAKITLTTNDPVITEIRNSQETIDLFGDDFLDDYGIEAPDELIERFQKNYKEFKEIQAEINKLKK